MSDLPAGSVTFLLTDIEGSTRLWEEHPEAMRLALARHHVLITAQIERHHGVVVKSQGEGDSVFAVFARATDAVSAACALQQALLVEPWPAVTPVRVRAALHTGEAELRDGDYYGPAVNRCARLRAAAHGGQLLFSLAAEEMASGALPEGVSFRDLGLHRLQDLSHPEHIFQLLHPSLPADFPALRSLDALPNNLPRQLTSFVGREQQMVEVKQLLSRTLLLTLTGAGGCGKTRLALQVAADLLGEYPDGVWLAEMAALADPAFVPQMVASALGVREDPGRPLLVTLVDYLRPKSLLLVLDNCEHLVAACAQLAEALLRVCPELRILTTSREALAVAGETTWQVPSLSLPPTVAQVGRGSFGGRSKPPTGPNCVDTLMQYEGVRLFVDRAVQCEPRFQLTSENAPAVAHVCQRLEGIPLAIELAAARVKVLSVAEIFTRLDDRFRLLVGGSRTALPRHQTLRATLDWSYQLLPECERALLRRLSVFAGGWTLEAAEAVCVGHPVEGCEVLDLLEQLVEKSLVTVEEGGARGGISTPGSSGFSGKTRYRVLETVREYTRDQLVASGEDVGLREQHRDWFLGLAEQAEPEFLGPAQAVWLERLEEEHANLRLALEWSMHRAPEVGLRLAGALWRFWFVRGHFREGREWLEEALVSSPEAAVALRAKALAGSGFLALLQGQYERAAALCEEGLAGAREAGDPQSIALSLPCLGIRAYHQGNYQQATALLEESLALSKSVGDKWLIALSFNHLWVQALDQGAVQRAAALCEQALALAREMGDKWSLAWSLRNAGFQELHQSDLDRAEPSLTEALAIFQELGYQWGLALCLEGLAWIAEARQRLDRAARLFGAAEALFEAIGASWLPVYLAVYRANYARSIAAACTGLGEEAFTAAWADGRAMSLDRAVAYALAPRARLCDGS